MAARMVLFPWTSAIVFNVLLGLTSAGKDSNIIFTVSHFAPYRYLPVVITKWDLNIVVIG